MLFERLWREELAGAHIAVPWATGGEVLVSSTTRGDERVDGEVVLGEGCLRVELAVANIAVGLVKAGHDSGSSKGRGVNNRAR